MVLRCGFVQLLIPAHSILVPLRFKLQPSRLFFLSHDQDSFKAAFQQVFVLPRQVWMRQRTYVQLPIIGNQLRLWV